MPTPREKLLTSGGLLIGIGVGFCLGILVFISSFLFLLRNSWTIGVNWLGFLVLVMPPIALALGGSLLLLRARRIA